jgi:fibronectin type 3 domain-containing protein
MFPIKLWFTILLFLSGITHALGQGQAVSQGEGEVEGLVHWTENGMVVFVSNAALSPDNPQQGRVEAIVLRRIGESGEFDEITRMSSASSAEEFVERAGEQLTDTLMSDIGAESEEELWKYIKANPGVDAYGFLGFEPEFWRAMGTAYFDTETASFEEGEKIEYEIRYVMEDGSVSDSSVRGSAVTGQEPELLRPVVIDRIERENVVGGKWASPIAGSEDALFANVYRQDDLEGEFRKLKDKVMARRTEDSLLVYQWQEDVAPEHTYRYMVEPLDIVGNPGPMSDTLTVISVDFEKLPLIRNVSAVDTTSGIHLSWDPVPNKSYITGVEIRRSRNSARDYIVMDTLSVHQTEYLDTRLVPNIPYYYEFRVVTVRDRTEQPSGVARASFRNNTLPPSPPNNLRAEQEENGIRLRWDANPEPDMFGYYVYRGTSRYDSMAVISKAIRDTTTFFDDSEELNGRTNYVYAVKSINVSELQSELSESVIIRPARTVRPPAPVGISGYAERNRIRLTWQDVRERDSAVEGYYVYRGREPITGRAEAESGSETAEENGYERLNEEMISANAFDDPSVTSGETYYYAVTSVDLYGEESLLSNTSAFTTAAGSLLPPSQVSVRNISDGVEIRWNATMQNGASGYRVYRRTRGDQRAEPLATLETGTTRYVDQNVQSGDFYWYSVSILGESAESDRSEERSVRIDANP